MSQNNQQAGEVQSGYCVLSGLECPTNVPELVVLKDSGKTYLVSKHCLDKYSRQLYVFGIACMAKMMNSKVLVSGMSGTGVEIAKNVILAGVKSFTVHDTKNVKLSDLSSNFYCTTSDINTNKNRAEACVNQLRELNDLVPVEVITTELTVETLSSYTVVVLVDYHETKLKLFGDYCHRNGICIIATGTYGLYGYSFSDFGPSHVVSDVDGEAPKAGLVVSFEQINDISTNEDKDTKETRDNKDNSATTTTTTITTLKPEDQEEQEDQEEPDEQKNEASTTLLRTVFRSDSDKTGLSDGDHISLSVLGSNVTFPITSVYKKIERRNTKTNSVRIATVKDFALFAIHLDQDTLDQLSNSTSGPGYWTQVKIPTTITHQPFSIALGHQELEEQEEEEGKKKDRNTTTLLPPSLVNDPWSPAVHLHSLLRGIWKYQTIHDGNLPIPYNEKEARELVELGWKATKDTNKNEESLLMTLAMGVRGKINPMAAIFGGVVGQEVIKACSGKYTPIGQWLHLESCDCLPRRWSSSLGPPLTISDTTPQNSRYDGQIVTLGKIFQEKISTSKIFLVGSGALGCELLKNFAMTGICCDLDLTTSSTNTSSTNSSINSSTTSSITSSITSTIPFTTSSTSTIPSTTSSAIPSSSTSSLVVTDMDSIEISNLNRQFLFRKKDVRRDKSTAACEAASIMNPSLNVCALTTKVAPETESIYNDTFWNEMDCIVNALDNVQARMYVDSKVVLYNKPLFESGTLGVMSNVQPIVPHATESYSDEKDEVETSIPLCTLKQYPNKIEHTIQWARDIFEKTFAQDPQKIKEYLLQNNKQKYLDYLRNSKSDTCVSDLKDLLLNFKKRPITFNDCIQRGSELFDEHFVSNITALLKQHPKLKKEKDGSLFWSGHRKLPTVFVFDPLNVQEHSDFLFAASKLYASSYSISLNDSDWFRMSQDQVVQQYVNLSKTQTMVHSNQEETKFAANEEERKEQERLDQIKMAEMLASSSLWDDLSSDLSDPELFGTWMSQPEDFEKDDDFNHHMDFITAGSNLRCANYDIRSSDHRVGADRMRTKQIAGRIIPAIATTTAMTTGIVCLELFKYLVGHRKCEKFLKWNLNLGINMFNAWAPVPCARSMFGPKEYSKWDSLRVSGSITLHQLLQDFELLYGTKGTLSYPNNPNNLFTVPSVSSLSIVKIAYGSNIMYDTKPGWFKPLRMKMSLTELICELSRDKDATKTLGRRTLTLTAKIVLEEKDNKKEKQNQQKKDRAEEKQFHGETKTNKTKNKKKKLMMQKTKKTVLQTVRVMVIPSADKVPLNEMVVETINTHTQEGNRLLQSLSVATGPEGIKKNQLSIYSKDLEAFVYANENRLMVGRRLENPSMSLVDDVDPYLEEVFRSRVAICKKNESVVRIQINAKEYAILEKHGNKKIFNFSDTVLIRNVCFATIFDRTTPLEEVESGAYPRINSYSAAPKCPQNHVMEESNYNDGAYESVGWEW